MEATHNKPENSYANKESIHSSEKKEEDEKFQELVIYDESFSNKEKNDSKWSLRSGWNYISSSASNVCDYSLKKIPFKKKEEKKDRIVQRNLDPNNVSDACKILSIEETQIGNAEIIGEQFKKIASGLEKRKAHTEKISPRLAIEVQQLIEESERAYNTLIKTMKKN